MLVLLQKQYYRNRYLQSIMNSMFVKQWADIFCVYITWCVRSVLYIFILIRNVHTWRNILTAVHLTNDLSFGASYHLRDQWQFEKLIVSTTMALLQLDLTNQTFDNTN